MARPMILIQEPLLRELWHDRVIGAPLCKLINRYSLPITHPTLAKLFEYMQMLDNAHEQSNVPLYNLIQNSLWPEWLSSTVNPLMRSPPEYFYTGTMPVGKWVKRDSNVVLLVTSQSATLGDILGAALTPKDKP